MFASLVFIISIIFAVVLFLAMVYIVYMVLSTQTDITWPSGIMFVILFIALNLSINLAVESNKSKQLPRAIDVVRGNTELVIVYNNDVPVDTMVVYKNTKVKIIKHFD